MLEIYKVATFILLIMGLAFLLVWAGDRSNRPAWFWAVAHLALSLAAASGYGYQVGGSKVLALVSLIMTSVFLTAMYVGNQSLAGRKVSTRKMLAGAVMVSVVVAGVGFGGSELSGHILVMAMIVILYLWSGWLFLAEFKMPLVGSAFLLKSGTSFLLFTDGSNFSTIHQSTTISVMNWAASVLLAMCLVFVAVFLSRKRYEQAIRYLPDPVLVQQADGTVVFCNEAYAVLAGIRSPEALIGRSAPVLLEDDVTTRRMASEIHELASKTLLHEPMVLEQRVRPAVGRPPFPAEVTYSSFLEFGRPLLITQIRDLTEREAAEQERLRLTATDRLTGLANRQSLEMQLSAVLWDGLRQNCRCAVLMVDIDRFTKINDALGYLRGDELLKDTARLLDGLKGERDLLARVGADEFALVMTGLSGGESVFEVERRATEILRGMHREIVETVVRLTIDGHVGIAYSQPDDAATHLLLQRAQLALQHAKSHGPGEFRFFKDDMGFRVAELIRMESALRVAATGGELRLVFQPIVSAKTGELVKVEALVRWNSPIHGVVSPQRFIALAEQSGLIIDLGHWIMEQAIRQSALWGRSLSTPPVVGINVSVKQFLHRDFEQGLMALLQANHVSPEKIELEMTESLFAQDDGGELQALLDRLRECGISLSLDDFGTGYSSLSYLARFSLSTVKIDRSFVTSLDADPRKRSIVKAIISMSHSLGLKVVAEGVESEAERACLLEDGCDFLQGYLLGKPMPPEGIAGLH